MTTVAPRRAGLVSASLSCTFLLVACAAGPMQAQAELPLSSPASTLAQDEPELSPPRLVFGESIFQIQPRLPAFGESKDPADGRTSLLSYRERGLASWYGKAFHGRKTSSGDAYNMYAMTAAHPSLPIPSYVRVTNLANNRSAVVRINDRGPLHASRVIDLSYAAAYKLGFADQGQAQVELSVVLPEEVAVVRPARTVPPLRKTRTTARPALPTALAAAPASPAAAPPLAEPAQVLASASEVPLQPPAAGAVRAQDHPGAERTSGQVFLHLAAFPNLAMAEQFRVFVEQEMRSLKESVSVFASEGKYRLQMGPYASALEARSMAERIAENLKLKPLIFQR